MASTVEVSRELVGFRGFWGAGVSKSSVFPGFPRAQEFWGASGFLQPLCFWSLAGPFQQDSVFLGFKGSEGKSLKGLRVQGQGFGLRRSRLRV